jgi:myo-inositol 2-dehydrogenase/D-chiro-inositol 1-dehydrogenase
MGRDSAYTGKAITWEEGMNSTERLGPSSYALGPMTALKPVAPVPGKDTEPTSEG